METTTLILRRYSPYAFSEKEITDERIQEFLEAARWAPSANNEQPWRFQLAPKKDTVAYEKLFACLNESNQVWATSAPVLMLVLAKRTFARNNAPNPTHMFDTGMAIQNFILSALESDVYVHQMGGFDHELARKVFEISDDYSVISMAAMGYLGDNSWLPERLQQRILRPRIRKPLDELLFQM